MIFMMPMNKCPEQGNGEYDTVIRVPGVDSGDWSGCESKSES